QGEWIQLPPEIVEIPKKIEEIEKPEEIVRIEKPQKKGCLPVWLWILGGIGALAAACLLLWVIPSLYPGGGGYSPPPSYAEPVEYVEEPIVTIVSHQPEEVSPVEITLTFPPDPITPTPTKTRTITPTYVEEVEPSWQVVFYEDFSDPASNWVLDEDDSDGTFALIDGQEYIMGIETGWGWVSSPVWDPSDDFILEFDLWLEDLDEGHSNIVVIQVESTSGSEYVQHTFVIELDKNGYLISENEPDLHLVHTYSSAPETYYSPNIFTWEGNNFALVGADSVIEMYANGELLDGVSHPTDGFTHQITWYVYNYTIVGFDEVYIYEYRRND
ncbi:MAG: hypothetical protein MUO76_00670, partial [Anaerolineaceae bacterium]|nr:hypothetical protein [Anaerolineaceae bacterium]